jgi:S1-C subfamily serine protease
MSRFFVSCVVCVLVGVVIGRAWLGDAPLEPLGISQAQAGPAAPVGEWENQPAAPLQLTPEEQTSVRVYEQSNPSVVNISTRTIQFDHFMRPQREAEGSGSGAILDKSGRIITNYHVVEGAKAIEVTLASGNPYRATLIGHDKEQDIALLLIDAPDEELIPIAMGRSDNLRVGQRVYVLGNPFSWDGTMTTGIISSLNRSLPSRVAERLMLSLIQTDAAMNPGNSGGPLLDSGSRMIGMCVAIATKTGQNSGVGFAIPIDRIKLIVPELVEHGRIVHADIGITHVMETETGLVIARMTPNGPADQAGLLGFRRVVTRRQRGPVVYETETVDRSHADRILAVDGEPMRSGVQFRDKIWQYAPGDVIKVTISRNGKQLEIPVTLGSN